MGSSKTATWVLGTAVVALVLFAGSWLLAISPRLESATEMRTQAESEQSRIDQLEIQLTGLEQDFANIEEFRNELSVLQEQIPTRTHLSQLTRDIETLATAAGVVVTSVAPTTPTTIVVAAPAVVAPPVDEVPAAEPAAEGEAVADSAAAPPVATTSGYYVVQINLTTLGGYEESLTFLQQLQTGTPRLVLVSGVQATSQSEAGASAGRPAVAAGGLELRLVIYAIVLPDPMEAAAAEPTDEPTELPVPSGQPNPFEPLG